MATIGDISGVIEHLKNNISIDKVVGEVVHLQSAGNSDVSKGVCCFHNEKTPSLTVTKSKRFYHCFGCKAGGDIVTFYKEYHQYNTIEAIYMLAERYNVDISKYERELTEEEKRKLKLLNINKKLMVGLHNKLMECNNRGYDYLMGERGISEELMADFQLGYCESLRDVYSILKDEDPSDISLLQLDNDMMFTDAIIYPLMMPNGDVIGFKTKPYYGGRTVADNGAKLAKYVGTSNQSPVFDASALYGMSLARKSARKGGKLVIVEGQHDVIGMRACGIDNVVGSEGTALTEQNIRLLEEYGIREIVVLYDGDNAGREASMSIARGTAEMKSSISIKIATITDGYDPDKYALEYGPVGLMGLIESAVYANQYIIDRLATNLDSVTARIDFIKAAQRILANAPAYEIALLVQYVADKAQVRTDVIEDMLREEKTKGADSLLYNLDGERIVLGGMLRDPDFRINAISTLRKDDWFLHKNQVVFDMMVEMEQQSIDVSIETLKAVANNKGYNQLLSDGAFIDEISLAIGDYRTLIDDITDKSYRRQLIKQSDNLARTAKDFKNRLPLVIEEHIDSIVSVVATNDTDGVLTPNDGAKNFMNVLLDRMQNPNQIVGIPLTNGFASTTSILNGLQKKKLITIAANQSVGKTTLVCNWMDNIAVTQGLKWAHFTLEMPGEEIVTKIIGIRAGVNTQNIERGNLTDDELARVRQATIDYHEGNLIVYDDKTTLEQIVNETRKLTRNGDLAGISIDYVQLMQIERSRNRQRYEELGDISGILKNDVAKKMNIPVVILSQLGKSAIDAEVAKAEHGSGSYKIAQDSDVYITLKEKSQEEIEQWGIDKGNIIMNIDKNRGGRADVLLDVIFQRDIQVMREAN